MPANPPSSPIRRAFILLFLGATSIGLAPILVRFSEVGPSATAAYRVLFALPLLLAWLRLSQHQQPTNSTVTRTTILFSLLAGAFFAGDLSLWHWSLKYTTVANSTLLTNLAPVLVAVVAHLYLRETVGIGLVTGFICAMSGGMILASESLELSKTYLLGDTLAVGAALFYAAYLLTIKQLRTTASTPLIMTLSALATTPILFLVAWISGEQMVPISPFGWSVLLALGWISHLGGQCLITYSLRYLPASFSALTLLWQPVVAALLAALLLKEGLTFQRIVGGLLVLTGIGLASGFLGAARKNRVENRGSSQGS